MSELFEIEAQPRSDVGKGASRRLRLEGRVPGIIYGARKDSEMISLSHNELVRHLEHEAFYSHILTLKLGDRAEQVILKDLQRHPAKPFVQHADFLRVSAHEKIRTNVPIHVVGDEESQGIKRGGAVSLHLSDIEIICLPKDLPEYLEVDVSPLEIGDTVKLSNLRLPEGVEIPLLAQGEAFDKAVASIQVLKMREAVEAVPEAGIEPTLGAEEGGVQEES